MRRWRSCRTSFSGNIQMRQNLSVSPYGLDDTVCGSDRHKRVHRGYARGSHRGNAVPAHLCKFSVHVIYIIIISKFYPRYCSSSNNNTHDTILYSLEFFHIFMSNKWRMKFLWIHINTFETGLMCMFWPFRRVTNKPRHVIKIIAQQHKPRVLIFINSL